MIGTALAGLILGLGGVTIGSSLVQASERGGLVGFFETLFGVPAPAPVPVPSRPSRPSRYVNLPDARRLPPMRTALHTPRPVSDLSSAHASRPRHGARRRMAASPSGTGTRTVCVRLCDGYLFPLGNLRAKADIPVHQAACAAACPNAGTSAYTLAAGETELDRAISPQGLPYRASALANIYRQRRVDNCSCQPPGGVAHLPIERDQTLRRGDVVSTRDSAVVVTARRSGSLALVDFRKARLGQGQTRQIEARFGALQREEQARAFRRTLRSAERGAIVRVAAAGSGFAPVRIVGAASVLP